MRALRALLSRLPRHALPRQARSGHAMPSAHLHQNARAGHGLVDVMNKSRCLGLPHVAQIAYDNDAAECRWAASLSPTRMEKPGRE